MKACIVGNYPDFLVEAGLLKKNSILKAVYTANMVLKAQAEKAKLKMKDDSNESR